MNYRVVWKNRLVSDLTTRAFLAGEMSGDASAIPRAVDEIEWQLTTDPDAVGESRSDTERALIVEPLTVIYEVFPATSVVVIYDYVYHPAR